MARGDTGGSRRRQQQQQQQQQHKSKRQGPRHVVVMVLGDVGRSPRMQYHALSLVRQDEHMQVSLVGYRGERCVPAVEEHPRIQLYYVDPLASKRLREISFLLFAAIKIVALVLQLFHLLLIKLPSRPDILLVQNPPSIPTLLVAWIVALLRGSTLAIDWHNLGFSILAHSRGGSTRHPLVRIARVYEKVLGRQGHKHFCVTEAMRLWLRDNFGVEAQVLHDHPPAFFGPTSVADKHELFLRLEDQLEAWQVKEKYTAATGVEIMEGETLFTIATTSTTSKAKGTTRSKSSIIIGQRERQRPALVISSTSWTEDEDFGILLKALQLLDEQWSKRGRSGRGKAKMSPFLVVVVTGKGPQKAHYEALIRKLPLQRIAICTMWLEAADYPVMVGAADLGVSLHTSTSGIDLPMKVVDMFGCQVPVCALGFSCLHELVRHKENGLVFQSPTDLASCFDELLGQFPHETTELDKLQKGAAGMARWEENWRQHAAPYLLGEGEGEGEGDRWGRSWWLLLLFLLLLLGGIGGVVLVMMV